MKPVIVIVPGHAFTGVHLGLTHKFFGISSDGSAARHICGGNRPAPSVAQENSAERSPYRRYRRCPRARRLSYALSGANKQEVTAAQLWTH